MTATAASTRAAIIGTSFTDNAIFLV